jgi:hypothetical protein
MRDRLTKNELNFLYGISRTEDDVFDGRAFSQAGWKQYAKEAGKDIVLGGRCRKAGHRLRTRGGHCVQCDPKKLAFTARFSSRGQVYIAGSLNGRLIKLGSCGDWEQRLRQLCAERYGGYGDWRLLHSVVVNNMGEVENRIGRKLWRYSVSRPYQKDGLPQVATELYSCSYSQAAKALAEITETPIADVTSRTVQYEFYPIAQRSD